MNRLHPLSVPYRSISRSVNLGFLFFLLGIFASPGGAGTNVATVVGMVAVGILVAILYEVAYYRRFRYELTTDTFDVDSGVFSRRSREVPLRRIQNVDVRQNVFQRPLGIAAVHVETAGGGQTEITLQYVEEPEAKRLQRRLRRGEPPESSADAEASVSDTSVAGQTGADEATPTVGDTTDAQRSHTEPATQAGEDETDERLLFEIDRRELVILSVFTIDPGASLLATVALSFASGFDPTTLVPVDALDGGLPGSGWIVFAWVVLVFLLVAWALSAVLTFSRYYGFRLVRVGADLHYERGLLQRYSGRIPLDKVQTLTVTESVPFRWFGYGALAVETAGYAPGQAGSRGTQSAVPLAARDRLETLAQSIEPFDAAPLESIPRRARERYVVRYLAVVGVALVAAYGLASVVDRFDAWYVVGASVVLVPLAAHLKWRHRGFRDGDRYFHARTGVWRRTTKIVPYYRVQAVVDTRTIFQRRRRLATVTADTASSAAFFGRSAAAIDVDAGRAATLADAIESHLQEQLRERDDVDRVGDWVGPERPPDGSARADARDGTPGTGRADDETGGNGVGTDDVNGDPCDRGDGADRSPESHENGTDDHRGQTGDADRHDEPDRDGQTGN